MIIVLWSRLALIGSRIETRSRYILIADWFGRINALFPLNSIQSIETTSCILSNLLYLQILEQPTNILNASLAHPLWTRVHLRFAHLIFNSNPLHSNDRYQPSSVAPMINVFQFQYKFRNPMIMRTNRSIFPL